MCLNAVQFNTNQLIPFHFDAFTALIHAMEDSEVDCRMQVEEADHLQNLISAAHASNLDFYYALSPGLDIAYSNSKEVHNHLSLCCTYCYNFLQVATLKRKLDQVAQLGCKAFALLFDDIEAEMSKPDKEAFQSFAAAQVVHRQLFQSWWVQTLQSNH